jgi:hypothetical protein
VHACFLAGYAASIQTVFLIAVPIAALAFLAAWLIPQAELRRWPEAGQAASDAGTAVAGGSVTPQPLRSRVGIRPAAGTHETLDPHLATRADL